MFNAIVIDKTDDMQSVALKQLDEAQLPEGDVLIDVAYSTLNYKDGLAITGKSPIARKFPMVPGIDLVGTVRDRRPVPTGRRATRSCSTAGAWAKAIGAGWRRSRG